MLVKYKIECLLVVLILLLHSCYQTTQPETFILDNNKRFIVIYEEECGVEPEIKKGRRILNIPPDGILIIKSNFEDGPIDYKFFEKEESGQLTKMSINYHNPNDGQDIPGVRILGKGFMSTKEVKFDDSTIAISFYLMEDNSEEIYNLKEINEFNLKILDKINQCRLNK